MSFRKRINEELAKLSTTDLEQCPVTNKIEDDEVLLGEMMNNVACCSYVITMLMKQRS